MPPRSPRKRTAVTRDEQGESNSNGDVSDSGSDSDFLLPSTSTQNHLVKGKAKDTSFIVQTAFDAYFTQSAASSQTSNNVFSSLVPPLTQDEFAAAFRAIPSSTITPLRSAITSENSCEVLFPRFMRELYEGFNLLFYGFGSKRQFVNQFAKEWCSKAGHVIVVNGFQPDLTFKDVLSSLDDIPGLSDFEPESPSLDSRVRRVYNFYSQNRTGPHLFLVIHNIDASPFRSERVKSSLALWALHPRIHLVASMDHINSPLLWSSSDLSARKHSVHTYSTGHDADTDAPRGFAWLWHDVTTLAPYDFELSFADRTSIHGATTSLKSSAVGPTVASALVTQPGGAPMSETAALHILASVTQKAKKLFTLMGKRQIENIEAASVDTGSRNAGSHTDLQQHAISYDALFRMARDEFVVTNDTALRSLLGEFRDHGLILAAQSGSAGGEILWIPLRKERLASLLASMQNTHNE